MNRAAILTITVTAALAIGGCASTGLGSPDSWHVVKSKRFTMYTSTTMSHSETLNGLEYHYASLSSSFFKKDIGTVEVLFLENEDFTGMFGTRRSHVVLHRVPGKAKIGQGGLLVVRPMHNNDNASAEALTHVFIDRVLPGAPLWFHEGFSTYARMAEYKEGEGKRFACFGTPGPSDTHFIPLDKLFAIGWDEYDGDEARTWYKNTSRMLIDFAMHADGGKHQPAMGAIVEGILAHKDAGQIMKTAFPGQDLKQLSERVAAHGLDVHNQPSTLRGICPIAFPIPDDKTADIGDKPLSPADGADIREVAAALRLLPRREDGYPAWYPEEVIAQAEKAAPPAAPVAAK
jgi:hypothetical protein